MWGPNQLSAIVSLFSFIVLVTISNATSNRLCFFPFSIVSIIHDLVCQFESLDVWRFYEMLLKINLLILRFVDMKEPKIAAEIAKELRKFHQVDIPGSKEPQLWNDIFKFLKKGR